MLLACQLWNWRPHSCCHRSFAALFFHIVLSCTFQMTCFKGMPHLQESMKFSYTFRLLVHLAQYCLLYTAWLCSWGFRRGDARKVGCKSYDLSLSYKKAWGLHFQNTDQTYPVNGNDPSATDSEGCFFLHYLRLKSLKRKYSYVYHILRQSMHIFHFLCHWSRKSA